MIMRNNFSKIMEKSKRLYYMTKMTTSKNMWNTIKSLAGQNMIMMPRTILDNGEQISSPKVIADHMNEFFINKVEETRDNFEEPKITAIDILKKLIQKPETKFKLKETTIEKTKEYIGDLKCSNTTGFDMVTSRVLKLSAPILSVVITHAINSSIRKSKFQEVLKISRVLRILKPTKNPLQKTSYRPISNLHTMEKVFELHVKNELEQYFYGNKIIVDNHHGGHHNRSTMTAKAVIDAEIAENMRMIK